MQTMHVPFCPADSHDAESDDVEPASVALSSSSARCFSSREIIVSVLPRPMSSADINTLNTQSSQNNTRFSSSLGAFDSAGSVRPVKNNLCHSSHKHSLPG